jgi:hypothetical protein
MKAQSAGLLQVVGRFRLGALSHSAAPPRAVERQRARVLLTAGQVPAA